MQYARGKITHWCNEDECGAGFASRDDLDRHQREECPANEPDMWGYNDDEED